MFSILALGTHVVLIGKSVLCGLAVGGTDGIYKILEILHDELNMTMALVGYTSIEHVQ
ncbi:MAG: alpha-hydroxy-acid oxidizing protein [Alphaproteobacteria bacterium]|nr:alpha-hydroxy-acid oxidizing protein [Alphaproteobacteria bacterium]